MATAELPVVGRIREFHTSDDDLIRRQVFTSGRPAVLRGLVRKWPAVSIESPAAVVEYLRRFDNGTPVDAVMTPPELEGKLFYDEGMNGFNFVRNRLPLTSVAEQVLRYSAYRTSARRRRAKRVDSRLPAGILRRECLDRRRRHRPAANLARQRHYDSHAPGRVEQHRLRGQRSPPVHALSTRATREPLHRAARFRSHGRADESRLAARPRLHALSTVPGGAGGGGECRSRTRRCALHTASVVAPRRIAGVIQLTGELLVARHSGHRCRGRLGIRYSDSRHVESAVAAARDARGVEGDVRSLRVRTGGRGDRAHPRASTWHARQAFGRRCRPAADAISPNVSRKESDVVLTRNRRRTSSAGGASRRVADIARNDCDG